MKLSYVYLSLICVLLPSQGSAQLANLFSLKINDTAGGHDSLVFGNHQFATYCVDTGLGENYSPPNPPSGFWAVFLSIPGRANCFTTLGIIKKDLRAFEPPWIDTFYVQIANIDSIAQIPSAYATLRWSSAAYRSSQCDSVILVDPTKSLIPGRVDMFRNDSVVLPRVYEPTGPNPSAPFYRFFIYVYGVRLCVSDCFIDPQANTDTATFLGPTAVRLNGTVDAVCQVVDSVTFQYGPTAEYGKQIRATQVSMGAYSAIASGLQANSTYHFRIVSYLLTYCCASCAFPWYGGDSTFKTPTPSAVGEGHDSKPRAFALHQNFPNPFNPMTTISYDLPQASYVTLEVYDLLGRITARLVDGEMKVGSYTATWNAEGEASGMYFYRLQAGHFVETKKLVLMR